MHYFTFFLSFLLVLSCSNNSKAQKNDKVINFEKALSKCKDDVCRADNLYQIGKLYQTIDLDMAQLYIDSTFNLSERIQYQDKILSALIVKSNILSNKREFEAVDSIYNILKAKIKKLDSNYWNGMIVGIMARNYFRREGMLDSSKIYYEKHLRILDLDKNQKDYHLLRGSSLVDLGLIELKKNNHKLALNRLKEAEVYYDTARAPDKSKYYLFTNMGMVFKRTQDFDNGLKYYRKAYEAAKGQTRLEFDALLNIASTFSSMEEIDSMGDIAKSLHQEFQNLGKSQQCNVLSLLTKYYINKDSLSKAQNLNQEYLNYINLYGFDHRKINYYANQAMIEEKRNNFHQAVKHLSKARELTLHYGVESITRYSEILEQLIILSLQLEQVEEMPTLFQEFRIYKDSISTIVREHEIQKWREEYEAEKKELELTQKNLLLSKQNNQLIITIFSSIAVFVVGVFLIIWLQTRRKKLELEKQLIQEDNEKLNLLNASLVEENKKMKKQGSTEMTISDIEDILVTFQLRNRSKRPEQLKNVIFIEWHRNIATVYVSQKEKFEVRATIEDFFEHYIHSKIFIRVHKSYVVNILRINHITGDGLTMKFFPEEKIPLGGKYKQKALSVITSFQQS